MTSNVQASVQTAAPKASQTVELDAADLTPGGEICCPSPKSGIQAWSGHPRVFLHFADGGQARCPYCGTVYRLKTVKAGHPA